MENIEDQWKIQPSPAKDIKLSSCWEATQIILLSEFIGIFSSVRKCLSKNDEFKLSFDEISVRIFQLFFKILFTVISSHVKFIFVCLNCV